MTRFYRALLRAYPRWFRDRYRAQLVDAFTAERLSDRYAGRAGRLVFWIHIATDLAVSVVRVRLRSSPSIPQSIHPNRSVTETIGQDLRHTLRMLVRQPGFTVVAVLSLALGIGGNAMIFAFVDGIVLHPFPYPEPNRVVGIGVTFPRLTSEENFIEALSPAEFYDVGRGRTIHSIAAFDLGNRNISGGDRPERVFTALALTDLFGPFGMRPLLGRGFTEEELKPGAPDAAIISYRIWQSRFGGDPSIVGRAVRVNGNPAMVVGVMPRELLILGADLWIPWGADPLTIPRNIRQFTLIGRLAPGASLEEANAELAMIAHQTEREHAARFAEYQGWRLAATPWSVATMRDLRAGSYLLLGAVALVLLIACANLSNILLARSTTRQRELAVRLALGAGFGRIARHLLVEVAVLAVVGAAAGLLLARVGLNALISMVPMQIESLGLSPSLNWRVLAGTAMFTMGAAVMVALLPVVQATRTDPQDALKADGRGATSSLAPLRLRQVLVVSEVALSVMLLVAGGLFLRSFAKLRDVDLGLDPGNVLTMRLTLPVQKYRGTAINDFFQQLIDRVEQLPGVRVVSVASQFPPFAPFATQFRADTADTSGATLPTAAITVASAEHAATLGIRVMAGRNISEQDRAETPRVIAVNEAFVSRYLPGVNPLGRRLTLGSPDRSGTAVEIVGVVSDTRNQGPRAPTAPEMFVPLHQQAVNNQLFLLVRTHGEATALLPSVRQQIASLDPEQPVYAIRTMEEAFAESAFAQRVLTVMIAIFAAVALTLAAIGIYGVMSCAVSARTQEIGVRLAVGAHRGDVIRLVLGQVMRLTAIGVALGVILVVAAGGALHRLLFEVQPTDPLTIVGVATLLAAVALFAGWLPAWHASRIDPVNALRYE